MAKAPILISGVVRDDAGEPVAEARVYFTAAPVSLPDIAALTDARGEFSLSVPVAGTYGLEANANHLGRASATIRAEAEPDATTRITLTLKR